MEQHKQFQNELTNATQIVNNQITRLRLLNKKFSSMDSDFRRQIAESIKAGNNARAKVLAAELANVRKVQHTTQNMGIALEVVVLRCSTINEFANIMDTITPTVQMVKDIQRDISKVVPTANELINSVTNTTSEVLMNCSVSDDLGKISTPMDEDSLKILGEVEELLEQETKSKLPEVPEGITIAKKLEESTSEVLVEAKKVLVET
jgi:division protein CdvB (Snf7/Vps24/ESCRT-III family)